MDVTIKYHEGFTVLGVQNRINPMTADYTAIWEGQLMPHFDAIKALATEAGCYGVYFPTSEPPMVEMVAGMAVPATTIAPEGLVVRDVPASRYAVTECRMDAIGETWMYLFQHWQQEFAQYTIDFTKPCFEFYPPNLMTGEGLVTIYIPIVESVG